MRLILCLKLDTAVLNFLFQSFDGNGLPFPGFLNLKLETIPQSFDFQLYEWRCRFCVNIFVVLVQ